MFGLFKTKKITIPVNNAQSVTELESWTLEWESFKHDFSEYGTRVHNAKVFIKEEDMAEFKKQLEECAKFINSEVFITTKKN